MRAGDAARLIVLAAIWGGSFIFMRILAPVLGPVVTADLRVLIAGVALIIYFRLIGFDPEWKTHWRHYLIIGGINSGLPFFFYSFAALHIPASYSAILNSTSPFFGAMFSAIWLEDRLTLRKIMGLLCGAAGVALVVRVGGVQTDEKFFLAVIACLSAAVCYGFGAVYIKKFAKGAKSMGIAGGSQLMAGVLLLPAVPFVPATGTITVGVILAMLGLALICSAVAYLLYFRLIDTVGPTRALTVTFLMPVFGMFWGFLFLHETITPMMIAGTALILFGTSLVLSLFRRTHPPPANLTRK